MRNACGASASLSLSLSLCAFWHKLFGRGLDAKKFNGVATHKIERYVICTPYICFRKRMRIKCHAIQIYAEANKMLGYEVRAMTLFRMNRQCPLKRF
jgi:hypothetical protein